jgi:hypothetical protein
MRIHGDMTFGNCRKSIAESRYCHIHATQKYRDRLKLERLNNKQSSSYKCRQSFGKAIKRVTQSLPKDPSKRVDVIHHIAQVLNVIPKTTHQHKREQRSLPVELKQAVIKFYNRDDISYQMPGKRDCITVKDDHGKRITLQKRILLYSVCETHQLFLAESINTNSSLSITSFRDLRPLNILVQSHMSHRSCLCAHHENVFLLLKPLSKCIRCPDLNTLQTFSSTLVCNENGEKCMFSLCPLCANNFNDKIEKNVIDLNKQIQWYQWVFDDGYANKKEFNGTVEQCLTCLKEKVKPFLSHVFIKRQQASYFEQMKLIADDETICLQLDYSENFRMNVQDAIQGAYYSNNSVSLFTSYVWCSNYGYSFVHVSDDLTHDKYCISATLDHLFDKLKRKFQRLKQIHVFSDGAAQQFKQRFLFRNLCRLANEFKVDIKIQFSLTMCKVFFNCLDRIILALFCNFPW